MGKRYLARKDLNIFVADIEVARKYVLEEFAQPDERFLRRLVNATKVFYATDGLDLRYDIVEIPRSRRLPVQTIPAGILAKLLSFAEMDIDRLPPIPTVEQAEALLAGVPEIDSPLFQKKTPDQIIAGVREERRLMAREVSEDCLRQLRIWLAQHYEYIPTCRN